MSIPKCFLRYSVKLTRNMGTHSKQVTRYPLLHCFNCGQNSRGNFAIIVSDSDASSHCRKISSFIEQMWTESQFCTSTSTAQSFINSLAQKRTQDNLNSCEVTLKADNELAEIALALQQIIEAIKKGSLNVSDVLIASNKSFTIPRLFEYMQVMYAGQEALNSRDVLISGVFGHSYTCILPRGHAELEVCSGHEGDYCGLMPLGHPVTLTTTGLVWNLNDQKLQFDLLVSSSNQLDGSDKVTVKSDGTVLWTMGIDCKECDPV